MNKVAEIQNTIQTIVIKQIKSQNLECKKSRTSQIFCSSRLIISDRSRDSSVLAMSTQEVMNISGLLQRILRDPHPLLDWCLLARIFGLPCLPKLGSVNEVEPENALKS